MKKIIIFLFLATLVIANQQNINLSNYADIVSKHNNINIVIDEIIDKKVSLLIPDKISDKDLFAMFKSTVNKNGFNLKKYGLTYYLSKKLIFSKKSFVYHLKYNSFKDCEALLKGLGVSYTYLKDLNALVVNSTNNDYKKIESLLQKVDIKQKQVMLKFTIFEYSDYYTKERGVQYGSIYKGISGATEYALNTIVAPITSNNPLLLGADFYSALRLLNEDNKINVKQNPFILAKNNHSFKFSAVQNIPYLITTTTTEATNTSEQNSIEYKDVGLKIEGRSFIHDDYVTLDVDLTIEDLIGDTKSLSSTPETYKRVLKSNTNIQFGEVLLLSGLKRDKINQNEWSIPFISKIPYLGEIFKYSYDSHEIINITIAIEVVNKKEMLTLDSFCEE